MKNDITKYDFKNFLLKKESSGYTQDDLIFWKNRIPLPLDLVYRLYDERNSLIQLYLDHLTAIKIYAEFASKTDLPAVDRLPDKKLISPIENVILNDIEYSIFEEVITALAGKLGIGATYEFKKESILDALKHNGKKYSRIYIHDDLKEILFSNSMELRSKVGVSNHDMFGNIVCDYFNVYRSGFSDALASIFSDLVDYVIQTKDINNSRPNFNISIDSSSNSRDANILLTEGLAGNIYEPLHHDGVVGMRINSKHAFIESLNSDELNKLTPFLLSLSEIELNCFSDSKAKILEENRQEVSRATRIRLEKR